MRRRVLKAFGALAFGAAGALCGGTLAETQKFAEGLGDEK